MSEVPLQQELRDGAAETTGEIIFLIKRGPLDKVQAKVLVRSERAEQTSRRQGGRTSSWAIKVKKKKKDNRLNREESVDGLEVNLKQRTNERGRSFTRGLSGNISVCCEHLANVVIFPEGRIKKKKINLKAHCEDFGPDPPSNCPAFVPGNLC